MAQLNDLVVTGKSRFLNEIQGKIDWSNINNKPSSFTPASHTHGNIQNGGTLTTDVTIANGDKLVVTDNSDNSKIARMSISFDGSTTTQCLTKKGTWATFGTSNLTLGTSSTTALKGDTKYAGASTAGGAATSAEKLTNTSKVGDTNKPVYFTANGVPSAISYTIDKSVPSTAVFTDANVRQIESPTTSTYTGKYEVLFAGSTSNVDKTEGTKKSANMYYRPYYKAFYIVDGEQVSLTQPNLITLHDTDTGDTRYELRMDANKLCFYKWNSTNSNYDIVCRVGYKQNNGKLDILGGTGDSGIRIWYKDNLNYYGDIYYYQYGIMIESPDRINLKSAVATQSLSDGGVISYNTAGNAYAKVGGSTFQTLSSRLVKSNIKNIPDDKAEKLLDLRPVTFDILHGGKYQPGMIAEEVEEVLPELVYIPENYDEEEAKEKIERGEFADVPSLDYSKFVPYLIKLAQIQQKEIDELRERLTS